MGSGPQSGSGSATPVGGDILASNEDELVVLRHQLHITQMSLNDVVKERRKLQQALALFGAVLSPYIILPVDDSED